MGELRLLLKNFKILIIAMNFEVALIFLDFQNIRHTVHRTATKRKTLSQVNFSVILCYKFNQHGCENDEQKPRLGLY